MSKYALPVLLLWAATLPLFGQLAGTYTLGGTDADFQTLAQAVQQLQTVGVSGPVTVQLRPGTYPAVTVPAIPGTGPNQRVVFISEDGDSTSAVIRGSLEFNGTRWVSLQRLSLTNLGNQKKAVLRLWNTHEIRVENCHIVETAPAAFDSDEGLVKLHTVQAPDSVRNYFSTSHIASSKTVLVARNNNGRFLFEHSRIIGNWDLWLGEYRGYFWYNHITFHNKGGWYANELFYNTIDADGSTALDLVCGTFTGNTVAQTLWLDAGTIRQNLFLGETWIDRRGGQTTVSNNRLYGPARISRCFGSTVLANEFFGTLRISGCDGTDISNNFLYRNTEIIHGGGYRVLHNNLARGTLLELWYMGGIVRNNNISNLANTGADVTLRDNNYFPTTPNNWYALYFDANPRFFDPQYPDNETDLHTANPLLVGKAGIVSFASTAKDFDGKPRPFPATIGANEGCYGPDFPDTVRLSCAEPNLIRWCTAAPGHFWATTDLADTFPAQANLLLPASQTLYLHGPGGIADSVFFLVEQPTAAIYGTRSYYLPCGYQVPLNTYAPPGATVTWSPAAHLSDPNSPKPVLTTPDTTMQYVATIAVGQCALLRDTILIFVNPKPSARFYAQNESGGLVRFVNQSACADTYSWDFGDGGTSTAFEPEHPYALPGTYTVTLTAYNSHGTATYQDFIFVSMTTADKSVQTQAPPFAVYPNPSAGNFMLTLEGFQEEEHRIALVNMHGQVLHRWTVAHTPVADLRTDNLPPGPYRLTIQNSRGIFHKSLFIHRP